MEELFIFPNFFWNRLSTIISKEDTERAFYLVGTEWRNKTLIYDLVEFSYRSKSEVYVESNPEQIALLTQSLPAGLKIIGILHSHPFTTSLPTFSEIDVSDFKKYESGLFIVVSKSLKYKAMVKESSDFIETDIIIKDLEKEEEPSLIKIGKRWNIIIPKGATKWEIQSILPQFFSDLVAKEFLLGKVLIKNGQISLRLPIFVDVIKEWAPYKIPYRIYLREKERNFEEILRKLIMKTLGYNDYQMKLSPADNLAYLFKDGEDFV